MTNNTKSHKKKILCAFNTVLNPLFLRSENFPNFFWLQLVSGTTIEKKIQVVPGIKYGVLRYVLKKFNLKLKIDMKVSKSKISKIIILSIFF